MKMAEFMNYNTAFPGHQTAMPNPFLGGPGLVKYDDGAPATVDNYARDVTAFLAWTADPKLEERKRMGLLVMGYLLITAVLFGLAKRRIWRGAH
jgi:ubiquinol-cytochrome c reductase cytochrome c1 subunit